MDRGAVEGEYAARPLRRGTGLSHRPGASERGALAKAFRAIARGKVWRRGLRNSIEITGIGLRCRGNPRRMCVSKGLVSHHDIDRNRYIFIISNLNKY